MTAVTDAITVINILKRGGSATGTELQRIGAKFKIYAGSEFVAVDPENPTNEELAENFLLMTRRFGQSVLRMEAEKEARATYNATVTAAGDTAVADL